MPHILSPFKRTLSFSEEIYFFVLSQSVVQTSNEQYSVLHFYLIQLTVFSQSYYRTKIMRF